MTLFLDTIRKSAIMDEVLALAAIRATCDRGDLYGAASIGLGRWATRDELDALLSQMRSEHKITISGDLAGFISIRPFNFIDPDRIRIQ